MSTKVTKMVNQKKIAPYEDATRMTRIEVTPLDVKRAKCFAPDECVLAKAICRAFPNVLKAWFYENSAYVAFADPKTGKPTKTVRYIPSPEAKKNIGAFDLTKKFVPGTYRLDVPTGSHTLVAIGIRGKKRLGRRHMPTGKGTSRAPSREVQAAKRSRLQYAYPY